jgi:hypothetical protein
VSELRHLLGAAQPRLMVPKCLFATLSICRLPVTLHASRFTVGPDLF